MVKLLNYVNRVNSMIISMLLKITRVFNLCGRSKINVV
jgi:hypothetical protein